MKRRSFVSVIFLLICLIVTGKVWGSFMVDPDLYYWLPGGQDKAAISAGENSFLAVWVDEREGSEHIYGTWIAVDGSVDSCGFLISGDSSVQTNPDVAFGYYSGGKDNYLAVWWDNRTPAGFYGTRISGNEILDSAGIAIEIFKQSDEPPSIAYDNTYKYIVVWSTWDGDIEGRTVDVNGNVNARFDICMETGAQSQPKVSFNGTNFFVVWIDSRDGYSEIYGARVTPDGTVLDPGGIKLVNALGERGMPDVGFCGGFWLCVWEDTRDGNNNIYGTRVDENGNVLDDLSILISQASSYDEKFPAVSSDGNNFIVTYIEDYGYKDVVNAILKTDGTVSSHNPSSNSLVKYRRNMDVAFCSNVFFALWCHGEPYRYGIVGSRINKNGKFLGGWYGIDVGITATVQKNPDCVVGGDSALILWEDNLDGVDGEIVNLSGNLLKKFYINSQGNISPAVAFTDPYYLCLWHGDEIDSTIKARRITRDGVAMPEIISVVNELPYTPCLDVDAGEGTFCVGWINPNSPQNVYCSILDTGGVTIQPPTIVSNTPSGVDPQFFSVCFNDSNHNYLLAWHEGSPMLDSLFCTMVSKTGGILYQRVPVWGSLESSIDRAPSLTFDGTNYFCVWKDGLHLLGRWINIESEPGDSCIIPFNISNPHANTISNGYFITGEREGRVWAVRLSLDGEIVDTFEIGEGNESSVDTKGNQYLITWSSFTPNPYSSFRIWGDFGLLSGIEEENPKFETQSPKLVVYPNPFLERTTITLSGYHKIDTTHSSPLTLRIYDLTGRLIRTLNLSKSEESVSWDGRDTNGREVQSGIYFLKVVNHYGNKVKGYGQVKIVKLR